jgi:hypothetical protein
MAKLVQDEHHRNPEVLEHTASPDPCNPKNNAAVAAKAAIISANQAFLVIRNYWLIV